MTTNIQVLCTLLCIISVHGGDPTCKKPANITDSNKYYIPPSETPNFTTLEDYRGQKLHRNWNTPVGGIDLAQQENNAVQLSWTSYIIEVHLNKHSDGSIDQKWQFDTATVTLKIGSDRAVHQMWNLGKLWYSYERNADGSTKCDGTAVAQDLCQYKQEIDLWCEANQRFFPPEYCIIYDRL